MTSAPTLMIDLDFDLSQAVAWRCMQKVDPRLPWKPKKMCPDLPPADVRRLPQQRAVAEIIDLTTITRVDLIEWNNTKYSFFNPAGPRQVETYVCWHQQPRVVLIIMGRSHYTFCCVDHQFSDWLPYVPKRTWLQSALGLF